MATLTFSPELVVGVDAPTATVQLHLGGHVTIENPGGSGATTLNDLTDVSTDGAADGDALFYNGSSWEPGTVGASSGLVLTTDTVPSDGATHDIYPDADGMFPGIIYVTAGSTSPKILLHPEDAVPHQTFWVKGVTGSKSPACAYFGSTPATFAWLPSPSSLEMSGANAVTLTWEAADGPHDMVFDRVYADELDVFMDILAAIDGWATFETSTFVGLQSTAVGTGAVINLTAVDDPGDIFGLIPADGTDGTTGPQGIGGTLRGMLGFTTGEHLWRTVAEDFQRQAQLVVLEDGTVAFLDDPQRAEDLEYTRVSGGFFETNSIPANHVEAALHGAETGLSLLALTFVEAPQGATTELENGSQIVRALVVDGDSTVKLPNPAEQGTRTITIYRPAAGVGQTVTIVPFDSEQIAQAASYSLASGEGLVLVVNGGGNWDTAIAAAPIGGGGGAPLSDDDPSALGSASAGAASEASRADHVHPLPTPGDIGALSASSGYNTPDGWLKLDGSGTVPDVRIPSSIARDSEVDAKVSAAVAELLDGAPGALDTLNELAAAINDDASFAASVTTALAGKVPTARLVAGISLAADITAAALKAAVSSLGLLYGDQSDGDATISGTTTLTRPMHYRNLEVTGTLVTAGYPLLVDVLTGNGSIIDNGASATTNSGASMRGAGVYGAGGAGGSGATGAGATPAAVTAKMGGNGGAGGSGSSGAGGTAQTGTAMTAASGGTQLIGDPLAIRTGVGIGSGSNVRFGGGSGGSGGGGNGANAGGGGGAGGGINVVHARDMSGFTGTISANGGNGANGQASNCGGGGGGGGGLVSVVTASEWTVQPFTATANGGSAGASGGGAGVTGSAGSPGTVRVWKGVS